MSKTLKYPKSRWLMLGLFMFLTIIIEIQWLTHAPIARVAEQFYKDQLTIYSWLTIDSIAVIYMIIFLIVCLPASYIIDTYGIKVGIGIGALLTIVGASVKGIGANNLLVVFIGQIILAIGQPFILNAVTAFSVRWFPLKERAMCAGFLALAQYLGILIVMVVTPMLVVSNYDDKNYGNGVDSMLRIYMAISIVSGILVLLFLKEKPKHLNFNITHERLSFKKGIKHMFKLKDAILILILFTIGLGIFNAISTLVDTISAHLKIKDSDGLIGGIMLIGGIIGAVIIPILSDKYQKRKFFLIFCIAGLIPSIIGLSYALEIASLFNLTAQNTYSLVLFSSFILGFCIMSAAPIVFQYTAEITAPTPESTSQGILLFVGQISGILTVAIMSINNNAYLDVTMKCFVPLSVLAFIIVLSIKEPKKDSLQ